MVNYEVKVGSKSLNEYVKLVLSGLRKGEIVNIKALGGRIDEAFKILDEVKMKVPNIRYNVAYEPYISEKTGERKPRVVISVHGPASRHQAGGKEAGPRD